MTRGASRGTRRPEVVALLAVAVAVGGHGCSSAHRGAAGVAMPAVSGTRVVASNVRRSDYAGSDACASCHAALAEKWRRSPMHLMTRLPAPGVSRGPFDGRTWRFKDDEARLEEKDGQRIVRIASTALGEHAYRVTKVIGGRTREDYAGVEIGAPPGGDELILPVSWVYRTQSFRLKGYSVMVPGRPGLRAGGAWNKTCVGCHNTLPYLSAILGELHGPGAPSYQGEVVDRVMPADRRWTFAITDDAALARALTAEITFLGGDAGSARDGRSLLGPAIRETRDRLAADKLVEIGIGCEACHGGSREHVADSDVHPTFEPRAAFLRVVPAGPAGRAPSRAEWLNRACARCHQVLFSRYPWTWEGGARRSASPGGSSTNSGEARDFLLGACSSALSCTACHDPHGGESRQRLDDMATVAGNGACTACHPRYAEPAARAAHTHHAPDGAGSACVACHMPKKNMGLGYDLVRYHRIGSPTDAAKVERDRPLECALCHADKSVEGLVGAMERFWGKRYDRGALRRLYGDLGKNALLATLVDGKPHEKAAAVHVLGDAGARAPAGAAQAVARELTDRYPLVRYYAKEALEHIVGRPCAVDLDASDGEIEAQAPHCLAP